MDNSISTKLLQSCEKLFSDGIINESQYHLCKVNIGEDTSLREIRLNEKRIFGENRVDKEGTYNKFIKEIDDTLEAIFTHIENNPGNLLNENNQDYNPNNIYFGLLINFDYFMNNLINYVNKKTVNKYLKKESIHYHQLNNFYNQIDKNRKELKQFNKNSKTLDENNTIVSDKLKKTQGKKVSVNIFLLLIIILNIVAIIVYVKF